MPASYLHGPSAAPLLGESIGQCLDRIVSGHADDDALVSLHQGVRYTYKQLHAEVERAARGFLALGVELGDRVGIWSANNAEWLITQFASAKVGAILVNINPAYRLRELEYTLQQSGVSILIAARGFRHTDYVALLLELTPELAASEPALPRFVRLPELRSVVYLGPDPNPGGLAWPDLLERGDD